MIKALVLAALTLPAVIVPVADFLTPDAMEIEPLTRAEQVVADLNALGSCSDQAISVYFHDDLIESHSAEFLNSALYLAGQCDLERIQIVRYTTPHQDEAEDALSLRRADEIQAFVEFHGLNADVNVSAVESKRDSAFEEGRAAFIRFDMKNDRSS